MRYTLYGELQSCYSHDNSKTDRFEEQFDAENLETAVVISRAMLQNKKIQSEKGSNSVERLHSVLKDDRHCAVWSSDLVHERTETKVVTPEHFKEAFARPVDDDELSRSEQSA